MKEDLKIIERKGNYLFITDKGVINKEDEKDAQKILTYLTEEYHLGNKKVVYQCCNGIVDMIYHDNGKFTGLMSNKNYI